MIIGVTGLPGSGKSYYLVGAILKALRGDKKVGVISNFHPTETAEKEFGDRWRFGLWEDMLEAPANSICVVDEANMWFNSRDWKGQSVTDLAAFKQSRKNGIQLWWADQHENRVDVAIREVTHWFYRCERFYCWSYVRIEDPCTGKKAGVIPYWRTESIWQYYDSYERIGNRVGEGYGRGRAAKPVRQHLDNRLYRYVFDKWHIRYKRGPLLGVPGELVHPDEPPGVPARGLRRFVRLFT